MKQKPRLQATPIVPVADNEAVRIGYSPEARVAFERLTKKERVGLRRKLKDFGKNPLIGKPLTDELRGYRRVTYGRMRVVATSSRDHSEPLIGPTVIVYVLLLGQRRQGSTTDPYERAVAAILRGEPSALQAMNMIVREMVSGVITLEDDDAMP